MRAVSSFAFAAVVAALPALAQDSNTARGAADRLWALGRAWLFRQLSK